MSAIEWGAIGLLLVMGVVVIVIGYRATDHGSGTGKDSGSTLGLGGFLFLLAWVGVGVIVAWKLNRLDAVDGRAGMLWLAGGYLAVRLARTRARPPRK